MIHKACMPVYMNSGKIVAGRVDGDSKVLQEVLADLKNCMIGILGIPKTSASVSRLLSYFYIL